jgi:hypothetical protein
MNLSTASLLSWGMMRKITSPLEEYWVNNFSKEGYSLRQFGHQVAPKVRRRTRPL